MDRLNVGLIGLGGQSMSEHLPALIDSDRVTLTAVCDTNRESISRFEEFISSRRIRNLPKISVFSELDGFFNHEGLDFVVAVVPHHVYPDIIKRCSEKGLSLLKEKPFARNLEEALSFKAVSDSSKIKIMTAFQRRFHPLYESFKFLMRSLGKIHLIHGTYTISSKSPNSGWRGKYSECGGGVLLDMGYHIFDELIWFMESAPEWVEMHSFNCAFGQYDVEDSCFVNFQVGSAIGNLFISCISPVKREELIFIGERGSATLTRDGIIRNNTSQMRLDELTSPASWQTANIKQLDYFVDVLQGKREEYYSTPTFQLNNNVPVLEACYKSQESRKKVFLSSFDNVEKHSV